MMMTVVCPRCAEDVVLIQSNTPDTIPWHEYWGVHCGLELKLVVQPARTTA